MNYLLRLKELFATTFGEEATLVEPLQKSGSNRLYYRLSTCNGTHKAIGTIGTNLDENKAFLALARHFTQNQLPVPALYAVTSDKMAYLQEDLGTTNLFDIITQAYVDTNQDVDGLLRETLSTLPLFQFKGVDQIDFSKCYPVAEFNRRSLFWDLNYFKYSFLKPSGVDIDENKLEDEFELLARRLLEADCRGFMYRDFQSRNVMIKDSSPYFIDFQGGRKGPAHYDVASFLWQARAGFTSQQRKELLEVYLDSLSRTIDINAQLFKSQLPHFVLFRMLQVLGAYGFRGLWERKSHFIGSIPAAIQNVNALFDSGGLDYSYIAELFAELDSIFTHKESTCDKLVVKVNSFAYKNGIPADDSGNGGGHVFDCRAIHNPGRFDKYKPLTGRDHEVARFLEDETEMPAFLTSVFAIVDASVEKYLARGFTSLMVSFGCTGGRHRSVYAAERLARHIHDKYNVEVRLNHREQNINQTLTAL